MGQGGHVTMLVITKGFATLVVGCVPSYELIGNLVPILIITMRLIQGFCIRVHILHGIHNPFPRVT